MNIFKTLASGSGRLYEPNVSAFLGYLLNPKEDHGLGDAFLREFLKPLLGKDSDMSIRSNFEIEVLLEQAFKSKKGDKDIVDIVILCYEREPQKGTFLAETIIKQKQGGQKKPKHIFLIENKINVSSLKKSQLDNQFDKTIYQLDDWGIEDPQDIVSVIYLTPDGNDFSKEYDNFEKTDNKCHLLWSKKDGGDSTATTDDNADNVCVSKMIKDILKRECPPIDAYCKYTLQAFLEFIQSNFKSTIMEEIEKKKGRDKPHFKYKGKIYDSRPELIQKLICDFIQAYEDEHKEIITYEKLEEALYKGKKINPSDSLFAKEKDALNASGTIKHGKNWSYRKERIKIKNATIRTTAGGNDKILQELLEAIGFKLDKMRI